MKERDNSIELYRLAMIGGICFLHSISFGGFKTQPIYNSVAMFCVNGFVLISGYFGCRFRVSKIFKLYAVAAWCAILSILFRIFLEGEVLKYGFGDAFFWQMKSYWFLHAYVALMLASPILDGAFVSVQGDKRKLAALVVPFLVLVFGWSWVQTFSPAFPMVKKYMAVIPGYAGGGYSFLVISGSYVLGRCVRIYATERKYSIAIPIGAFALGYAAVSWLPSCLGINSRLFAAYNSPFVALMAVSCFSIFRRIKVPNAIGNVIRCLTPSVFAVYLLQTSSYGMRQITRLVQFVADGGPYNILIFAFSGIVIFVACFALDAPRRALFWIVAVCYRRVVDKFPKRQVAAKDC